MRITDCVYSSTSVDLIMIGDNKASYTDQTVKIKKNYSYNEFEVTYTDRPTSIVHTITGLSHSSLMEYVYLLLKSLYMDEEGCKNVQVNIPGMPCMVVSANKLSDLYYREHFEDLIRTGVDLLANTTSSTSKQNRHQFFD